MTQLIEVWESFLIQLDADDDADPFYKPPPTTATKTSRGGETTVTAAGEGEQNDAPANAPVSEQQETQ